MRRSLAILLFPLLFAPELRPQSAGVVINEFCSATDWFEIANLGATPADVSGWYLCAWHAATPSPYIFQFSGTPGSGTVVLAPNEVAVVSESPLIPAVPVGVKRYVTTPPNLYPFASGIWGSVVLTDGLGNGIDYFAWGNPNPFDAPLEVATVLGLSNTTPALTHWTGAAAPSFGTQGAANDSDVFFRHSRIDTDSPADWSSFGQATGLAPDQSPGTLNRFQTPTAQATNTLAAAFQLSSTLGIGPLDVRATNTSSGESELVLVDWDFDAITNPGTIVIHDFNAHHLYAPAATSTYGVCLTVIDALGASITTPVQSVTVTVVPPPLPVAVVPFIDRFEGPLAANLTYADTLNGWDLRAPSAVSRIRTVDPRTLSGVAVNYTDATTFAGPHTAILDAAAGAGTTEMLLHIDLGAIGGACRLRYRVYSNVDDPSPEDVIAIQDGTTPGTGVASGGVSTGLPGTDGFKEALLDDWNTNPVKRLWTPSEHVIDGAWLAAHGLSASSDIRVVFRQFDNGTFESGDGLLIDDVEVLPLPIPGAGQSAQPGAATFDVNESRNLNGSTVGEALDPNGPFFVNIANGDSVLFRFSGEPAQPIVLVTGALTPGIVNYGAIGRLDLGQQMTLGSNIPTGLVILADGSGPNVLDLFFRTNFAGTQSLLFGTNGFMPGTTIPMQCAFYNSQTVIRLSNAVVLHVL